MCEVIGCELVLRDIITFYFLRIEQSFIDNYGG